MGKGRAGREVAVSALQSACTDDISTSLATAERGEEGTCHWNQMCLPALAMAYCAGSVRSRGTQAMALQGAGILVYSTAIGSEPQELNFHDH
uniref:Uncharacterized protein n=1 Tax=Salix viminalis TaxID=40686 RepID=A0A6N2M5P0_SALVM